MYLTWPSLPFDTTKCWQSVDGSKRGEKRLIESGMGQGRGDRDLDGQELRHVKSKLAESGQEPKHERICKCDVYEPGR